jgi:hypothetical protein
MNEFETRLSQISLRGARPEWRDEILREVRAAQADRAAQTSCAQSAVAAPWKRFFTLPRLALAAAWMLIAILRCSIPENPSMRAGIPAAHISLEQMKAHLLLDASCFAELAVPAPSAPRPKSPHGAMAIVERRRFA